MANTTVKLRVKDELKVKPDMVMISLSVKNEDRLLKSNESAFKEAYKTNNKVIEIAKKYVKDTDDITVSSPFVTKKETYVQTESKSFGKVQRESEPKTLGYVYMSSIMIKVPNDGSVNISKLISELYELNKDKNDIKNLTTYTYIDNKDEVYNSLLAKIIEKGNKQVESIAKAAGLKVDTLLSVTNLAEDYNSYTNRAITNNAMYMSCCSDDDEISETIDIQTNEMKIIDAFLILEYSLCK